MSNNNLCCYISRKYLEPIKPPEPVEHFELEVDPDPPYELYNDIFKDLLNPWNNIFYILKK